ncbi:MAG: LamG domain-containing protein [Planctomycetota bacterium]
MCKKLLYLVSLILVLGIAGNISADLVVHWGLDEGSGTTAFDTSGNGYDGEFIGDPQWVDGHGGGGALEFDGEDDNVLYSLEEATTWPAFSVTFWVKATTLGQDNYSSPFSGHFPNSAGFQIDVEGSDPGSYRVNPSGLIFGTASLDWVHLALVAEGTAAKLYYNGELTNEGTLNDSIINQFRLGQNRNDSNTFAGTVDEFRVYDHAISEAELMSAMEGKIFPYAFGPEPEDDIMYTDTWVSLAWKPGGFAVSHDVYIGENFEDVNSGAESAFLGNQATTEFIVGFPGMPYPEGLVPGTTYYWRIDEVNDAEPNSPWKGDVWSFWIQPEKAYEPSPADGVNYVLPDTSLNWEAGMAASLHYAHFGENFDDVNNAEGGQLLTEATFSPGTLESNKTYYWRIDEFAAGITHKGDVWSFSTLPNIVITDPSLKGWWTLDEGIGTTAVDWSGHGNHGIFVGEPQWVPGYDGYALEFDGSNYVDTGYTEDLANWTITAWVISPAVPSSASPSGPVHREQNYQFNWNHGNEVFRGAAAVNVGGTWYAAKYEPLQPNRWYHLAASYDGTALKAYRDGVLITNNSTPSGPPNSESNSLKFGRHAAATQFFTGAVDIVRVYNKALTDEEILLTMRGDPLLAWAPSPINGLVVDIRDAMPLSWSAGDTASSHDVYLGTDKDAIVAATQDSPEFQGNQAGTSLSLAGLVELGGGDYFWRIDEIEADGTVHTGTVWMFTVPDYLLVDDIESYNDIDDGMEGSNRIYNAWVDGYDDPTNGSQTGHLDVPFYEETIVHSGNKSMPITYDNAVGKSEATLTLTSGRDWTSEGVNTLVIWYIGDVANVPETMYVVLNGSAGIDNPDANAALAADWTEWRIDLQAFGTNLTNVNTITIGFGNRTNPIAGGSGTVFFDDIRLYRQAP